MEVRDHQLRRLGQLHERFGDLLGADRLRLHPLICHLEARHQGLDLLDDLRKLRPDLTDVVHAAADLLGELVHSHHASGYRRLDLLHHLLDIVGRDRRLVGEATNPDSPAFSASIAAFSERRLVWSATLVMVVTT